MNKSKIGILQAASIIGLVGLPVGSRKEVVIVEDTSNKDFLDDLSTSTNLPSFPKVYDPLTSRNIGSKRYPANHPLALEAIAKAQEKRNRKQVTIALNKHLNTMWRKGPQV